MKRPILATFGALILLHVASPAFSASFDCGQAGSWVEKTICANSELSMLDEKLANQYNSDLAKAETHPYPQDSKDRLRNEQLKWLKFQRNTCKTVPCLMREYNEKLGGKTQYGTAWYSEHELTHSQLPRKHDFGAFRKKVKVAVYDSSNEGYTNLTGEDELIIHKIPTKPYLSIIEADLLFANAHVCSIEDEKAIWSENHWVMNSSEGPKYCELRLYPVTRAGKTKILFKDIDDQCRKISCGSRAAFDGVIVESD